MGIEQSREVVPSRPFRSNGWLEGTFGKPSASKLIHLIASRQWQKAIIRATMHPSEVHAFHNLVLYGVEWKLLPLHLACALNPPIQVVEVLLRNDHVKTARVPMKKAQRKSRLRRLRSPKASKKSFPVAKYDDAVTACSSFETTQNEAKNDSKNKSSSTASKNSSQIHHASTVPAADYSPAFLGDDSASPSICSSSSDDSENAGLALQLTPTGGVSHISAIESDSILCSEHIQTASRLRPYPSSLKFTREEEVKDASSFGKVRLCSTPRSTAAEALSTPIICIRRNKSTSDLPSFSFSSDDPAAPSMVPSSYSEDSHEELALQLTPSGNVSLLSLNAENSIVGREHSFGSAARININEARLCTDTRHKQHDQERRSESLALTSSVFDAAALVEIRTHCDSATFVSALSALLEDSHRLGDSKASSQSTIEETSSECEVPASSWFSQFPFSDPNEADDFLPLHIACLFRASQLIVEKLLATYPAGAQAKNKWGMLPIHIVCSGMTAPPPFRAPHSVDTFLEESDTSEDWNSPEVIRALLNAYPKSIRIPSSNQYRMTPIEWVDYC